MLRKSHSHIIIPVIYLVVGSIWIYATYELVHPSIADAEQLELLHKQTLLRVVFIGFSSLMLFGLIRYYLRKLEARAVEYQKLFLENPQPMWVYDKESLRFLAVNRAAIVNYGYAEKEFLSMTIRDIRPSEEFERLERQLNDVKTKTGFYQSGTWLHQRKDGSKLYASISTHVVEWNRRKAEMILAVDVTPQVRAEQEILQLNETLEQKVRARTYELAEANQELTALNEEMASTNEELKAMNEQLHLSQETIRQQANLLVQQSEQRLNTLLNTLHDAVYTLERSQGDFIPVFVNPAIERIYGHPADVFLADTSIWFSQVLPEDQPVLRQSLEKIQVLDYAECEYRVRQPDGSIRWVLNRGWKQETPANTTRVNGIITDITQRKEFELLLASKNELLEKLFDHLPIMVSLNELTGRYLFVNKSWCRTLGWSYEEAQTVNILEQIFPEEEYRNKVLTEMPRDGTSWYDVRITNREGQHIETTWIALPMNDGTIISLGRDVTEERKREQEKSTLIKQLVDQNNNLTQFSFIASHNLRGPVASILGLLSICDERTIGNEHNRLVLQNLHSVAQRLDDVIKDLTHILELRAHQPQAKEWIRFDDLLSDIKQSLLHQILTTQPQFQEEFTSLESIFSVKTYLQSIMYNLIANAIKYRRANEPLIIRVQSFADRESFGFSVEDNGCGIDLQKFGKKLFTLYQRFHLEQEGKGLGLFLVKTQVEALRGKVKVNSQPDVGTRFTVSFPWEGAPALREAEPVLILAPQR